VSEDTLDMLVMEVNTGWGKIKQGRFWRYMLVNGLNKEVYRLMMTQIYFYTRHNAINQAMAAYKTSLDDIHLLRFVFKHASEELGHQNMVVHDLQSIGLLSPVQSDERPLPATAALIAFLYQVALEKGAVARLGYSFWAESVYDHIRELLDHMRNDLQLLDKNMTFFISHAVIDAKHSREVNEMITASVRTEVDKAEILDVAKITLYMSGMILDQVLDYYLDNNPA
jgi:pyrroloquinoline quinone (PQQ) biosynthesis protein C